MSDEQSAAFQLFIITKRYTFIYLKSKNFNSGYNILPIYKMYFSSALKGHSKNIYIGGDIFRDYQSPFRCKSIINQKKKK